MMTKERVFQVGVRPKFGTKAHDVLLAIERLHERGELPVTRNRLLLHCPSHIDVDDINTMMIYLKRKGFLKSEMVARVAKTGPTMVEAFNLLVREEVVA